MKQKITLLLVVLSLVTMLTGCSAVGKVETAINHIGTVSLESRAKIEEAEALYVSLPAEERASVRNYSTLVAAREEYDRLNALVWRACSAVDAIGVVTADSGEAILWAEEQMDSLNTAGLGAYAADREPTLRQAKLDFVPLACDAGEKSLSQREYDQAYTYFSQASAVGTTPNTADRVCNGLANAVVGFASESYNDRDLENAMYMLEESRQYTGTYTAEASQLLEKVEKKLRQQRPKNGKVIQNTVKWEYGELTVLGGYQDTCVKLQNIQDESKFVLVYVRANEKATVRVADGDYILKYTTGPYWYGASSMFGMHAAYSKADDILTFTTDNSWHTVYEVTLYSVEDGNMSTEDINSNEF